MKTTFYKSITVALACLSTATAGVIKQPNIIIFYVDDLGWQDVQHQ